MKYYWSIMESPWPKPQASAHQNPASVSHNKKKRLSKRLQYLKCLLNLRTDQAALCWRCSKAKIRMFGVWWWFVSLCPCRTTRWLSTAANMAEINATAQDKDHIAQSITSDRQLPSVQFPTDSFALNLRFSYTTRNHARTRRGKKKKKKKRP